MCEDETVGYVIKPVFEKIVKTKLYEHMLFFTNKLNHKKTNNRILKRHNNYYCMLSSTNRDHVDFLLQTKGLFS